MAEEKSNPRFLFAPSMRFGMGIGIRAGKGGYDNGKKEIHMEQKFTFETDYDINALSAMAGALRKTVRKKHFGLLWNTVINIPIFPGYILQEAVYLVLQALWKLPNVIPLSESYVMTLFLTQ